MSFGAPVKMPKADKAAIDRVTYEHLKRIVEQARVRDSLLGTVSPNRRWIVLGVFAAAAVAGLVALRRA